MSKTIDPKQFGLPAMTQITQLSPGHLAIVINRSSRIIMKDGERLAKYSESIKKVKPGTMLSIKTSTPVCSKTKAFLAAKDIGIIEL